MLLYEQKEKRKVDLKCITRASMELKKDKMRHSNTA